MKNKSTIILIIVIAVLFFAMVFSKSTDKNIDWTPTYTNKGTNPYDTYITYQLIKDLFDEVEISRKPIYNQLNENESLYFDYYDEEDFEDETIEDTPHSAYIFINQSFELDRLDLECLLDYADAGNDVFISAENFPYLLLDTLNIKDRYSFYSTDADTTYILKDYPNKKYKIRNLTWTRSFTPDSTFTSSMDVLGYNTKNDSVFIRIPFGDGNIYLHTVPTAFTNYYQTNLDNYDYAYRCLSYIPQNSTIIWDEYQTQGLVGETSFFRTLFTDDRLLLSLWLGILGFLIFMLFRAKRVQRIIPVINKPVNSSVEFLETISNLYYRKKDFATIIERRHAYLLDFIRKQFYLSTETIDEDFINTLSAKSGVDTDDLYEIFKLYNDMMSLSTDISNSTFLRYNELLEIFYKTIKN